VWKRNLHEPSQTTQANIQFRPQHVQLCTVCHISSALLCLPTWMVEEALSSTAKRLRAMNTADAPSPRFASCSSAVFGRIRSSSRH
jgi:hypothetical protein